MDFSGLPNVPGGTVVVALRHGRTASNAKKLFLGQRDEPLDAEGELQAARILPALQQANYDGIYCSPLQRARQTIAGLGVPVVLEGLTELDLADLDGTVAIDALNTHPEFLTRWGMDPTDVATPGGGETMGEVQRRAVRSLEAIGRAHVGGRVLVCAHQMVIASTSCWAEAKSLNQWRKYMVKNVQCSVFGVWPDRIELLAKAIDP